MNYGRRFMTFEDGIKNDNGSYSIYAEGDTPVVEGRFGSAVNVKNAVNYLCVEDFLFDSESFSISSWINVHAHSGDPVVFGNKDWSVHEQ